MFKKLLSNLPFNPSLIGQVSFYAKRLHRESAIRRAGFVVMALALILQMFAVFSPPQPSLASSSADLITGGFSSRSDAAYHCRNNTRNYGKILDYYGIRCTDIDNASTVTIKPTDYNKKLYVMSRLPFGTAGEVPVNIPGAGTLYLRHFWSINSGDYKALKVTNRFGQTVWLLYVCGNLIFVGIPTPPKVCQYNSNLLATDAKCFAPCPIQGKETLPKTSPDCYAPCPYNKSIPANSPKCFEPCPVKGKETLPKSSPECYVPCPYNSTISDNDAACKPCEQSQTRSDLTACLTYEKTATNTTQNITNANGTTARGGDVIVYTLKTKNTGKVVIKSYVVNENASDVLDYADIVDLHGGTLDNENVVSWPKSDIAAGATLEQKLTVRIKSPIPNTPTSISDPAHYDMTMTNVYGNSVNIKLPPTIIKTTEVVVRTLPDTGPGTSLMAATFITMIIGYFFARSRLLAKELDIVRADFGSSGGY